MDIAGELKDLREFLLAHGDEGITQDGLVKFWLTEQSLGEMIAEKMQGAGVSEMSDAEKVTLKRRLFFF